MTRYNVNQNHLEFIKYLDSTYLGRYTNILGGIKNIPNDAEVIVLIENNRFKVYPMYLSEKNNTIKNKNINIFDISVDDIEYYEVIGEKYREQIISGGGSTGINIGGALLGALIAGDAGMILGGQRKVEEIQTKTVLRDTRCICINYFVNKCRYKLFFPITLLDYLEDNIPEKEKDIVKTKKKNRMVNKSKKDKLDELESLYKDGVITESEYKESRSNILSS